MPTNRKITVTAWSEPHTPVVSKKIAHRQFLPPVVIGLAGSLLLHVLVLQTVVLGSRAHKIRPPDVQERGSLLNKPAAKPADALVYIDLPKTGKASDEIDEALAPVRAAIKNSLIFGWKSVRRRVCQWSSRRSNRSRSRSGRRRRTWYDDDSGIAYLARLTKWVGRSGG